LELPDEIGERRLESAEIPAVRDWIARTRRLAARGLVRPDVGELAELLVAVALDGTRARRGEKSWDVRVESSPQRLVQVKSVWHLPHRTRQNLGDIAADFSGEIWVVPPRPLRASCPPVAGTGIRRKALARQSRGQGRTDRRLGASGAKARPSRLDADETASVGPDPQHRGGPTFRTLPSSQAALRPGAAPDLRPLHGASGEGPSTTPRCPRCSCRPRASGPGPPTTAEPRCLRAPRSD
jgi:hypothetical protein